MAIQDIQLVKSVEPEIPTVRDVLAVVFRQRRVLVGSFITVFLCVFLYGALCPKYTSEMKVLVRRGRVDPVVAPTPSQAELVHTTVSEEDLNSEVELLRDDELLTEVVNKLESAKASWLHPWEDQDGRTARAARRLRGKLTVEALKKTSLVSVKYEDSHQGQAQKVLQAISVAYLQRHKSLHRPSGESEFFEQQVLQARNALESAQARVVDFSKVMGVVSADFERDAKLRQLSEMENDRHQSEVAIAGNEERAMALRTLAAQLPERTVTVVKEADNPELLQRMKSRLLDLELSRTELLAKYEPSYRAVREVEGEIAKTKELIVREEKEPVHETSSDRDSDHEWAKGELLKTQVELKGLRERAAVEDQLIRSYRSSAGLLNERAIDQQRLLEDMKEAEQKYLLYANKREEARIGDALDQGGILNVVVAEQPTAPALPRWSMLSFAGFGLLAGGVLSVGAAFANDYLSPAFRTPDEVAGYLDMPVLAYLPSREVPGKEALR